MRFLVSGSSGFLGSALRRHLTAHGHEVVGLVRGEPGVGSVRWDPYGGALDPRLLHGVDVVVNLAGAPLAHWPWTRGYRRTFVDSRVTTTRTLAEAIARSDSGPALLAQNGVAGYGDRGDAVLTEDSPTDADTFMGEVTRAWESATGPAREAGARVVVLRSGVVLDKSGGALRPMLVPFRLGVGGRIGDGRQYFSTISLTDWLRAVTHLATATTAQGAYNLSGPQQTSNAEFTAELGRQLHRPTFMTVPAAPVKALLGPVSSEILGSARVEPARLASAGFEFAHPTLSTRIAAALT